MENIDDKPVKLSVCQKCDGWVRAADPNYLETDTKARNEFKKEVFDYDLLVKTIPLKEYRKLEMCKCD